METTEKTGVDVAWMRCGRCTAVGRVILGTAAMGSALAEARRHVEAKHEGESAVELLELVVDDAAVFQGQADPREDPVAWVDAVNAVLPPDF